MRESRWRQTDISNTKGRWHLVVSAAAKFAPGSSFAYAAPLFEEEWNAKVSTLPFDGQYPFRFHRTSTWSAFTAHDHPMNSGELKLSEVFKQRFDRKKTNARC